MKKIIFSLICISTVTTVVADGTNQLADEKSRASYAIGMMIGRQWRQQEVDIDPDIYVRGIKDVLAGGQMQLTPNEADQAINAFQKQITARQPQLMAEMAAKNKTEGGAFLAANKNKPGVKLLPVTLPDGKTYDLQYIVVTNGTGEIPAATDIVTVNYRGAFVDGWEFDSSSQRGQPATFPVTGVIPGWTAALEKMPVGSSWKLFVPSEIAYGESGSRNIPPNSTLIFDVDLLSVHKATPPPPALAPPAPLTSDIIKVPSADEMKKGAKIETIPAAEVQKMQQEQGK
ncbi:MAG TPA: FKBP-type peptidyl-prolyl cis-trans isomerase [Verrucomicrobiae bacterium]